MSGSAVCGYERCVKGDGGVRATFHQSRFWHRFCCEECKTAHANARRQEGLALLRERSTTAGST